MESDEGQAGRRRRGVSGEPEHRSGQRRSPVRDGDTVTVCGSRRDVLGPDVIRVSSFTSHGAPDS
jgi:hypothetical protein